MLKSDYFLVFIIKQLMDVFKAFKNKYQPIWSRGTNTSVFLSYYRGPNDSHVLLSKAEQIRRGFVPMMETVDPGITSPLGVNRRSISGSPKGFLSQNAIYANNGAAPYSQEETFKWVLADALSPTDMEGRNYDRKIARAFAMSYGMMRVLQFDPAHEIPASVDTTAKFAVDLVAKVMNTLDFVEALAYWSDPVPEVERLRALGAGPDAARQVYEGAAAARDLLPLPPGQPRTTRVDHLDALSVAGLLLTRATGHSGQEVISRETIDTLIVNYGLDLRLHKLLLDRQVHPLTPLDKEILAAPIPIILTSSTLRGRPVTQVESVVDDPIAIGRSQCGPRVDAVIVPEASAARFTCLTRHVRPAPNLRLLVLSGPGAELNGTWLSTMRR